MPRLLLLLAVLLLPSSACSQRAVSPEGSPPPAAGDLVVERLDPAPIRLDPADLPAPYATSSASKGPRVIDVPERPVLFAPSGFRVNLYADDLDAARWLALTPEGDVLVAASGRDRIYRLRDGDGDGIAETRTVFADAGNGLNRPFGMAFAGGAFYVANTDAVLRFSYDAGQEALSGRGETVARLPGGGHWTRSLAAAPSGDRLYVAIGSNSNVSPEALPRASVQTLSLQDGTLATYASGLRNPVGLAVHPGTGTPYTVVNERDGLGDDLVPDYLTGLAEGAFYGWPYAYLSPDLLDPRRSDNGRSERPEVAARTRTPDVLFQAHSAPLGLAFYDGTTFPARYRGGAFVAFHGSWNRSRGTGYKVVFVPFGPDGRPSGAYEDFLTGFLVDPSGPAAWGRPVGLLVLPDGSLLVADDAHGRLYRVRYAP